MKPMLGWKKWLPLIHVHLVQVAVVNLGKLVLLPLESSQVSHAYVWSIMWSGDLQPSFHMCSEHTKPLIDLFKEKKFLLKSMPYARMLYPRRWFPLLNSVVFYYKTTLWSCLSWTTCSHDGGSPVIWKSRWVVVEPISNILSPPWFMLNINLVLKTL